MSDKLFVISICEEEFAKQSEDTKQDILDSELVLCRDCRNYNPDADPEYERCSEWWSSVEEDDFCSRGVRRDE